MGVSQLQALVSVGGGTPRALMIIIGAVGQFILIQF